MGLLTGMASIRATSTDPALRRPGQAVALAEKARQLSRGQDPQAWDALASAYAALGDYEKAAQAARDMVASRVITPDMERAVQGVDRHFAELREFTGPGLDIVLRRLTEP
mgnify:CR=1 FL=1